MLGHDRVADRKTETGAPTRRLGGEEGLEDLREIGAPNSLTLIHDFGDDAARILTPLRAQRDGSLLLHRVHRVEQQRHEDLDELLFIRAHDGAEGAIEIHVDLQPLEPRVMLEDEQRALDGGVDVHERLVANLGAAEVEQRIDDALAALHFALDEPQPFTQRVGWFGERILQTLGARGDRRQRIVDLVHDTGGERADGGELLRLVETLLRLAPIGDVLTHGDHVRDRPVVEPHGNLGDAKGAQLAGRSGLHLEDLQPTRGEHLIELATQHLGRLAMQDLEDRAAEGLLARHTLHARLALAIPHGDAVLAVDDVQADRQRVDDAFGDAALAIDLARAVDDLGLEALRVCSLAQHGCEDVGHGGEKRVLVGIERRRRRQHESAERITRRIEPDDEHLFVGSAGLHEASTNGGDGGRRHADACAASELVALHQPE